MPTAEASMEATPDALREAAIEETSAATMAPTLRASSSGMPAYLASTDV